MTDHDALFSKLMNQEKLMEKLSTQFDELRKEVIQVAVQRKEIDHLTDQVNALWRKIDGMNEPNGILSRIREYQGACPGDALKRSISALWGAVGLVIALIGAIKIWG